VDLGRRKLATSLAVNQREWSPTYSRSTFGRPEDSARIKDYRVHVSNDGINWTTVRTGAMRSARGVQFVDLGLQFARYLKLEVLNTWAGPQAPVFHQQLKIDEIKVAYGYPLSFGAPMPLEAESVDTTRTGRAHLQFCLACSGSFQVVGLGGGTRNAVTYTDVTVPADGDYRLEIDHTAVPDGTLSATVNGGPPVDIPLAADNADVPAASAVRVTLHAGTNTVTVFSNAARGPGIDRISVGPPPLASYTPATTLTVRPHGVRWVSPGQQSVTVSASLRLDADDAIDGVTLAPTVPAGWTITGSPQAATSMRLGQTISGTWTLTSPAGADVTSATIPVVASFGVLGVPKKVTSPVQVKLRPADRVFMREAEDSQNRLGSTGLTGCGPCSGGEKVRNIGGDPTAYVLFPDVTVDRAGMYTLFIDFTVNGPRSYFVSVNGGAPVQVAVDGLGNNTPYTTSIPVTLQAGANTIKVFNDTDSAPDLDRLSLGS
jgi:hypothetical protein